MNEYKVALVVGKNDTRVTMNFTIDAKNEASAEWIAKSILSKTSLTVFEVKSVELVPKKEEKDEQSDVGNSSADDTCDRETDQNQIPSSLGSDGLWDSGRMHDSNPD